MSARYHYDGELGFTLVELLVTLALLSLMLIYSASAFSMLRDIDRVSSDAAAQEEVDAVARYLRDALADMRLSFRPDDDGTPQLLFNGNHDHIQFVTAANGERETGGLYAVGVAIDPDGRLVTTHDLIRPVPAAQPTPIVLLQGVAEVGFSYGSEPSHDHQIESTDDWVVSNQLPSAIRVTVRFPPGDRRSWPDTLVPVRAAQ